MVQYNGKQKLVVTSLLIHTTCNVIPGPLLCSPPPPPPPPLLPLTASMFAKFSQNR